MSAPSPAMQTRPEGVAAGRSGWRRSVLSRAIIPVAVLVLWQVLAIVLGSFALASPLATLNAAIVGFERGWMGTGLLITLRSALYASLISSLGGIFIGFLLGRSPFWRAVFEEPLVWLYSIPKVVLYPILVLALGLGMRSNIGFAVLQGAFPPLLIMTAAVADLPAVYVKLAKVQRLSPLRFFLRVVLPFSLPSIALGLRYGFGLSYLGIVVAEMFAGESGIGNELIKSIALNQVPRMFAIVAVVTLIALAVNFLFLALESSLRAHHPVSDKGLIKVSGAA